MKPSEVRAERLRIAQTLKAAEEALRAAQKQAQRDTCALMKACKHRNKETYSGTPYDSWGKECKDCGKDLG